MTHPIPSAALDDRLFFGGTSGSGKTYGAGTAVERLLNDGARVVIPDPLGVWWGLALAQDGKRPSVFRQKEKLVIFGGPRGDLGLTEHSGALIGETVAGMAESCILDLSELKTGAAERRFMLAFLTALYAHKTREPLHIVFDEADLWAPQRVLDKEGEAMKLLGMMENICRRGRVKGFIPWLISQRPAVISKNVLSQIDGMIAFKLTSVQDRDAIGDWVQGQADKAEWAKIWSNMPTLERGNGLVWLPARGILKTGAFPTKVTFDSSRAPERGKRAASAKPLQPVNLDKLKERLATVEAETKANDPRVLRAELMRVTGELNKLKAAKPTTAGPTKAELKAIEDAAYARGEAENAPIWLRRGVESAVNAFKHHLKGFVLPDFITRELEGWENIGALRKPVPRAVPSVPPQAPSRAKTAAPKAVTAEGLTPAKQRILDAIAWASSLGNPSVPKDMIAFMADTTPNSSAYANNLGALRSAGLIDYPSGGMLALTDVGNEVANQPEAAPTHEAIMGKIGEKLAPAQMRIIQSAVNAYPADLGKDELAELAGTSSSSSAYANNLGRLRTLGLLVYPSGGRVRADDRLFPAGRMAA